MLSTAMGRYRLMANIVGTLLLVLVLTMVLRHGFGMPQPEKIIGPLHGILYIVYLVTVFQLALEIRRLFVRGSAWVGTVAAMVMGGWVPGLAFYVEHRTAKLVAERSAS